MCTCLEHSRISGNTNFKRHVTKRLRTKASMCKMETKAEIQSDVSAILLELIHMEIVSHLSGLDHKECQVCRKCCVT